MMKNVLKTLLLAVLSIIFGYLLFNWVMSAAIHSRGEIIVPDVKGKSLFDAVSLVSSFNLALKMEGEEFDQDIPAGTVIRQSPYPGITVREGKIIKVTISQGGEVVFVPDLVNKPIRSARISIRSSGLSLGEESTRYSVVYEKGNVISQDPEANNITEKDSLVYLVLSAGPPQGDIKLMPDWVGKNAENAKQWAQENEIHAEFAEEENAHVAPGVILSQEPEPDSDLADVEKVILVMATSSEGEVLLGKKFNYKIPVSGGKRQLRLTLLDENGEKEIFNGIRPSGSNLELYINPHGQARVRIYVNNVLVEEREVE